MKATKFGLALIALLLFFFPVIDISAQDSALYQQDFEGDSLPRWELETGWEHLEVDGSRLLQGEGHSWARLDVGLPETFRLRMRVRVLRGRLHIVSNMNDSGRYYFGFSQVRSDANKQYWPDLFEPEVAVAPMNHALNVWHEVEILGDGGDFSMQVDGKTEWEFSDSEPLGPGTFALESLENSLIQVDDIEIFGESRTVEVPAEEGGDTGWVRTGGPLGGLGYDVRMDPDNPDRMYVTDAFAGVFISEDGGESWFPSNSGITDRTGETGDAIPVFCLTIHPDQPEVVWVGTQFSGGLFKSSDRGHTWTRKTDGITIQDGLTFRGISVDPNNPETLYAAGEISSWAGGSEPLIGREFDLTQGVVYKSSDGGESWREVWRGDNLARYIIIDPRDSNVVFVSTGIFDREAANSDPQTGLPGGEGVIKSIDGGETWNHANDGLGNLYVGTLFIHPEDADTLLAGTGNVQYHQNSGVYLSVDGAETWEQVLSEHNIESVEYSLSEPDIAYAGSDGAIFRSDDRGRTWKQVSGGEQGWGTDGIRAGFPIDFQVDPRDPMRIFSNNYGGGNFLSEDGGATWINASNGYTGAQVRDIAVAESDAGLVYAAARSGIFVSADGGELWQGAAFPPHRELEWYAVAINPENSSKIVAANNWHGGIYYTDNGGLDWDEAMPGIAPNHGIRVLRFAHSDPNRVYAGSSYYYSAGTFGEQSPARGLFRSDDGGLTWASANDPSSENKNVTDISVSPENADNLYAATGSGLLKSDDGGKSWRVLESGLPTGMIARSVAISPHDPNVVLVGYWFGGVYRSTDAGASWTSVSVGMNPNASVTSIVFDPDDPELVYLADMLSGVYKSTDGGMTWRLDSDGLRMRTVNRLAITGDGDHLYAATEGEGVYRLDLAGQLPSEREPLFGDGGASVGDQSASGAEDESSELSEPEVQEPAADPEADRETGSGQAGWCPGSYLPFMLTIVLLLGSGITGVRMKEH